MNSCLSPFLTEHSPHCKGVKIVYQLTLLAGKGKTQHSGKTGKTLHNPKTCTSPPPGLLADICNILGPLSESSWLLRTSPLWPHHSLELCRVYAMTTYTGESFTSIWGLTLGGPSWKWVSPSPGAVGIAAVTFYTALRSVAWGMDLPSREREGTMPWSPPTSHLPAQ